MTFTFYHFYGNNLWMRLTYEIRVYFDNLDFYTLRVTLSSEKSECVQIAI